jgi:hypothetical protein
MILLLTKYYTGDHIKKNEMGSAWGRGEVHAGVSWGIQSKRDHLEDPDIHEKIILRWIIRKWDGVAWTGLIWLMLGTGACTYKSGNEPSCSIKHGEFLS